MDFVIFGMGLGATLVVLGWFWRTFGPRFRYRSAGDALLSGEQMVSRFSWTRFCRSGGAVWVLGGCLLLFAALVSLLLHLSDHTGALVVLAAFAVFALGVIAWLWAYLHRFGLAGLVAPRPPKPQPAAVTAPPPARPVLRQPQPAAVAATPEAVAAEPAAVAGPPIPSDLVEQAATATTAATTEEARPKDVQAAMAEGASGPAATEEETATVADAPDSSPSPLAGEEPAPTVIGAERRQDAAAEPGGAASVGDAKPATTGEASATPAGDIAARAETRAPEDATPEGMPQAAPAPDEGAVPRTGDAGRQPPTAGGEVAGPSPAAPRPFGSAAFRESIARQEAHLSRAAMGRVPTQQAGVQPAPETGSLTPEASAPTPPGGRRAGTSADSSVEPRRYPAPRGAEGVHWVRDDGSGRIPAGFPVKGDPATRLYYPTTSELYERATARYFFASPRAAEASGYRLASPPKRLSGAPDRSRATAKHPPAPEPATPDAGVPVPAGVEGRDWVRASDTNTVPAGFPIKGNASSMLYHPAGSRSYDRTVAEFYFASPERAEAAGYQLPRALRESGTDSSSPRPARTAPGQPQADHDTR